MSFLNITDLKKRGSIVDDYLPTVKSLQHRDERVQDLARQDDLNRIFEPVVKSTGKSTQAIREELASIREERETLNGHLANRKNKRYNYREAATTAITHR